jgi:hypothetical protein
VAGIQRGKGAVDRLGEAVTKSGEINAHSLAGPIVDSEDGFSLITQMTVSEFSNRLRMLNQYLGVSRLGIRVIPPSYLK